MAVRRKITFVNDSAENVATTDRCTLPAPLWSDAEPSGETAMRQGAFVERRTRQGPFR
jgi:hypothetical protein